MNDDYLWDRSGDPNEEVQALEELLGTLRYQPAELPIPDNVRIGRQPIAYRIAAIAAAVALVAVALGLWRIVQNPRQVETAKLQGPVTAPAIPVPAALPATEKTRPEIQPVHKNEPNGSSHIRPRVRVRHIPYTGPRLSAEEIAEAEAAKQQLLLALRVTSAKLNWIQKRTLNTVPANLIRNQHKIG
ncbi:MAG TPA: hypothetical protein VJT50_09180 [Pyrinomonadaceae bacterium]|nr:hypothetical protein [Pyrinomonadaceae bacterium]